MQRMTKSILNVVLFASAAFWANSLLGQDAARDRTVNDNALVEKAEVSLSTFVSPVTPIF